MSRTNVATRTYNHAGGVSGQVSAVGELRRTILSCFLWEDCYYENGQTTAQRIAELVGKVSPVEAFDVAVEAAVVHNLRHVPLLIVRELARTVSSRPHASAYVEQALAEVIRRPDSLTEFLSLYWQDGRCPLAASVKRGLARAFQKFNAYSLAKYNRDTPIKLRDVMFLVHPKPVDESQAEAFSKLAAGTLESPDTWEVALSNGANKTETFTRLIEEGNLGYLALLRNLRGMMAAGVNQSLVEDAILARQNGADRVLPFRYIAAARACPRLEPALDKALVAAVGEMEKFDGSTVILVDVSGSMSHALSSKSDLNRMDAAATLASIFPGRSRVFTFSREVVEVPPRVGMAGVDAIINSQRHSSTYLGKALEHINATVPHDRIIVITDEQHQGSVPNPVVDKAYIINVAPYRNGVAYGAWTHVNGFSEQVLNYIRAVEE